jgi:hypothetical protein
MVKVLLGYIQQLTYSIIHASYFKLSSWYFAYLYKQSTAYRLIHILSWSFPSTWYVVPLTVDIASPEQCVPLPHSRVAHPCGPASSVRVHVLHHLSI